MKSKTNRADVSLFGTYVNKTTGVATFDTTVTKEALWDDLVAGPIVRGNHKAPNPWNYTVHRRWSDKLTATAEDFGTRSSWQGRYTKIPEGLYAIHASELDAVRLKASDRLLESIRGGLDVSIDLAQYKKTVATGKDVKHAVSNLVKCAGEVGFRRITMPIKAVGNAWLLFTYGVKPTLQTIHESITEARNHAVTCGIRNYSGRAKSVTPYTSVVPNWPDSAYWVGAYKGIGEYRALYKVRLYSNGDTLAQAARWSSLNPVSIAWELMPWSFVVDWFINVGDYLRQTETALVYNNYFKEGFLSESYRINSTLTSSRNTTVSGATYTGNYKAFGYDSGLTRSILGSLPSPPIPKVKPELGSGRLLNAAALLTTFLRR